ncbi:Uncharacterised protein [Yersinia nurmii]|uniref:Lipoprotein n=1 Tax=Yersinia nurmii TaxID=685706 RepID=A0ABM9SMZ4_9GAMM|nr:Uncharacterised protein [Yersinia nurmii]
MRPEQILALLRAYPDANITSFHRSMRSTGGGSYLSGGATGGCTLNYTDPAYAGFGGAMENQSIFIELTYVMNMRHLLTEERWEIKEISAEGTIYRLKPEFMPDDPSPYYTCNEELALRKQERLRLLSAS